MLWHERAEETESYLELPRLLSHIESEKGSRDQELAPLVGLRRALFHQAVQKPSHMVQVVQQLLIQIGVAAVAGTCSSSVPRNEIRSIQM